MTAKFHLVWSRPSSTFHQHSDLFWPISKTYSGIHNHLLELLIIDLQSQPHFHLLHLALSTLQRVVHPSVSLAPPKDLLRSLENLAHPGRSRDCFMAFICTLFKLSIDDNADKAICRSFGMVNSVAPLNKRGRACNCAAYCSGRIRFDICRTSPNSNVAFRPNVPLASSMSVTRASRSPASI
jgi:hypothetical protein